MASSENFHKFCDGQKSLCSLFYFIRKCCFVPSNLADTSKTEHIGTELATIIAGFLLQKRTGSCQAPLIFFDVVSLFAATFFQLHPGEGQRYPAVCGHAFNKMLWKPHSSSDSRIAFTFFDTPHPNQEELLPYMGYIGVCTPKGLCGFFFSAVLVINKESNLALKCL